MDEYIKRASVLEEINEKISNIAFTSPYQDEVMVMVSGMERVRDSVEDATAADVAPVVHGRWLDTGYYGNWKAPVYICSNCRKEVQDNYIECHKYCLHCGAKMEGLNNG